MWKSGMEERGSDGWCDVCYLQMINEPEVDGMRQEDYSKDWVMHKC